MADSEAFRMLERKVEQLDERVMKHGHLIYTGIGICTTLQLVLGYILIFMHR